jgi:ribonuclease BN (tRNA processing enzyme)
LELRDGGRVVIVDTGSFHMRRLIGDQLTQRGLTPADVTDLVLTHAHYDHSINWINRMAHAWAMSHGPPDIVRPGRSSPARLVKHWWGPVLRRSDPQQSLGVPTNV